MDFDYKISTHRTACSANLLSTLPMRKYLYGGMPEMAAINVRVRRYGVNDR